MSETTPQIPTDVQLVRALRYRLDDYSRRPAADRCTCGEGRALADIARQALAHVDRLTAELGQGVYRTCETCSAGTLADRPCGICSYPAQVAEETATVWQVMRHDERVVCLPSRASAATYCRDEVEQRHGGLIDRLEWRPAVGGEELWMVVAHSASDTGWAICPVRVVPTTPARTAQEGNAA